MGPKNVLLLFNITAIFLFLINIASAAKSTDDLATECVAELQKVVGFLDYAAGNAAVPPKLCCDSVSEMKESKPQCLCFIIEQAHNGSQQLKTMGVKEEKLLALPSACKLKNASISECPKLLGLASNSPDAAVFSDSNSTSESATPKTDKDTSPYGQVPNKSDTSNGPPKLQIHLVFPGFVAFLLYAFMAEATVFPAL